MNRYDWYPGDYIRDTSDLTMLQEGAFRRLLDWYYSNERHIPDESKFRVARAFTPEEQEATQWVLDRFFSQKPTGLALGSDWVTQTETQDVEMGWANERADREILKARPKIEAARRNGKLGGRPKKNAKPRNKEARAEKPSGIPSGKPNPKPTRNPGRKLPSPSPSDLNTPLSSNAREETHEEPNGFSKLDPDWDPGASVLELTGANPENHQRYLECFRAHFVGSSTKRTPEQWRQSYRKWAVRDAQEEAARPPRKSHAAPKRVQYAGDALPKLLGEIAELEAQEASNDRS